MSMLACISQLDLDEMHVAPIDEIGRARVAEARGRSLLALEACAIEHRAPSVWGSGLVWLWSASAAGAPLHFHLPGTWPTQRSLDHTRWKAPCHHRIDGSRNTVPPVSASGSTSGSLGRACHRLASRETRSRRPSPSTAPFLKLTRTYAPGVSTCGGGRRGVSEVESGGETESGFLWRGETESGGGGGGSWLARARRQCSAKLITPSVDAARTNVRMRGARQRLGLRRRPRVVSMPASARPVVGGLSVVLARERNDLNSFSYWVGRLATAL